MTASLEGARCSVCEEGVLTLETHTETLEVPGGVVVVTGLELARCTACGEDLLDPTLLRANLARIGAAKREAGLMP